jgi:hypothetical protein
VQNLQKLQGLARNKCGKTRGLIYVLLHLVVQILRVLYMSGPKLDASNVMTLQR